MARRVSFLAIAAGQSFFHGRPFLRIGMIAVACRSMMAVWQRRVAGLLPTLTRRSEEMERFQQFSTPLPMGLAAVVAAQVRPRDLVLEPSAGTGLLAILAEIDDHLDAGMRPSVILMNPSFSAMANVDSRTTEATARHLRSALARLTPGGGLVPITGASFAPDAPALAESFTRLIETAHLVFTGAAAGAAFAKHGTSFATRISVFDKCRGGEKGGVTVYQHQPMCPDVVHLLSRIVAEVQPRLESDQTARASQGGFSPFSGKLCPLHAQGHRLISRDWCGPNRGDRRDERG